MSLQISIPQRLPGIKVVKGLIILFLLGFLLLSSCGRKSSPLEFEYTASGSYLHDWDTDQFGDFLLVLALSDSHFTKESAFPFYLAFKNTGNKTITLDGILPLRSSAAPPFIDIWGNNARYRIGFFKDLQDGLLSDKKIVIRPGKQVYLIKGDLAQIGGNPMSESVEYVENVSSRIKKGKYYVQGYFYPTPRQYESQTEILILTVE